MTQFAIISHPDWEDTQKFQLNIKRDNRRDIGSDSKCWLTLPDPNLPAIVAELIHVGNHVYLNELPRSDYPLASEIKIEDIRGIRVDNRQFTVAGYKLIQIFDEKIDQSEEFNFVSRMSSWIFRLKAKPK